jgi:ElaB/YqjD/DUF883 family membrane-anchored ribosome-binding protein
MSSENDARIDSEIEQLKDEIEQLKDEVTEILNEQASHREELESLVHHAVEEEVYKLASAIREIQDEWEKKYPDIFLINKG